MAGNVADLSTVTTVGGLLMVRFNTNGRLDTSFGLQGSVLFASNADQLGPYSVYLPVPAEGEGVGPVETYLTWGTTVGVVVQANGDIDVVGVASAGQNAEYAAESLVAGFQPGRHAWIRRFGTNGAELISFNAPNSVTPVAMAASPPNRNGGCPRGDLCCRLARLHRTIAQYSGFRRI